VPKTKRTRLIAADRMSVWGVVSDPYHLVRWWPRAKRIEHVRERKRGTGSQWTQVFQARSGRDVRADFQCTFSREGEAYGWEQQIAGDSPFAKLLRSSATEIRLQTAAGDATKVTIEQTQKLRGINRFGGFMVKRATRRQLDEALDGLEAALGAAGGEAR
jgi:uncharacterized protein YndB with AHSA1/START domain